MRHPNASALTWSPEAGMLDAQDDIRRDGAEHNYLSHVHNLAQSRGGGYVRGHAQTQVALHLRGGLFVSVYRRPAESTAGVTSGDMAKVPPCQRRSTLSAA
jgi:hypothetical protein